MGSGRKSARHHFRASVQRGGAVSRPGGHMSASPPLPGPPPLAGFDASGGDVASIDSDVIPDFAFPIPHSAFAWGREALLGWRLLSGRSHYAQAACGRRPDGFALTPYKRPGPSVLPEPPRLLGSRPPPSRPVVLLRDVTGNDPPTPAIRWVKSERDSRPASPRRRTGLRVLPSPGQSHDAGCSP